ncbi:hypothetical protein EYF80_028833 [Liparis tanakae]|uniref:Uncharacterized protein n=1 Tax=Liparis tanakae TaxID=230148 RepID=A0A4Z2H7H3_9TELE|nr:hypothetical protein EYF80_028833 [Liparis tanakae]
MRHKRHAQQQGKDERSGVGETGNKKNKNKTTQEQESHPVFGKKQIDGGVSDDVHAQLEGLDLPELSWLSDLRDFHGLVVSRQEELPQTVPEEMKSLFEYKTMSAKKRTPKLMKRRGHHSPLTILYEKVSPPSGTGPFHGSIVSRGTHSSFCMPR